MLIHKTFNRLFHAFVFGAVYFVLESLWKGHWTDYRMFILSGLIGLIIGLINEFFSYDTNFILQCIVGTLIALLCECIFGYQWNIIEGLELWNYSNPPLSYVSAVHGQINLVFAMMWLFLSGVCVILDDAMHYYLCGDNERPYYRIGKRVWYLPEKHKI